ncbi:MAG TPA: hypothetical protein VGQ78_07125 [Vicinamibacteria bacterium]|nr:hypothetical protein [Vicinamibacteria bacterium]
MRNHQIVGLVQGRAVIAAIVAGLLMAGCGSRPRQVWFAPDLGSADLLELFTRPEAWRQARRSTDVFKFYVQQLVAERRSQCPDCGPNVLLGLLGVQAFRRLESWRVAIAIEAGALKDYDCEGATTAEAARIAIGNVSGGGGTVRYLSMDNPMVAIRTCALDLGEAAARSARFAKRLRTSYPALAVGESEPYPLFDVETIGRWITALKANGYVPAFVHLDVDRRYAAALRADVPADLRALQSSCEGQGIRFGVIVWGDVSESDRAYYDSAREWTTTVEGAIGQPAHTIFQSWAVSAEGTFTVPRNLPESEPYTHTRLINDGLSLLSAPLR